ncbi:MULTISPECIES: Hpt domain-containing protein [unclassified Rhizobium]|uniref:Hpt domain-containing protein n=1 Tax=unclassified Rhizobium TaxID=2613769 RepID=UPI00160296D1|nr:MULTISPECIES: Hpt domain-containing protein [unclassified Rhizobium]MBB1247552.1 Hpt domain-containing protein [Rhizobium sp. G21]MCV3764187.1 Hpt domain-containing protein [Rhizobium sp. TRM95796]
MAAASVAFEAPDNYASVAPSRARPIDLVHLARQTSGDKNLELEVLNIFARQARNCMAELSSSANDNRSAIAHRLKGAALAIGAFSVSTVAEKVEHDADDAAALAMLGAAVIEAENFILKLSR